MHILQNQTDIKVFPNFLPFPPKLAQIRLQRRDKKNSCQEIDISQDIKAVIDHSHADSEGFADPKLVDEGLQILARSWTNDIWSQTTKEDWDLYIELNCPFIILDGHHRFWGKFFYLLAQIGHFMPFS
jgi:hypothetical protein